MSWHCSRALGAGFLEATCLDGVQSALSSTTHTPEAYYWPDKTTEHSRLSRFGMTSEPLMADRGEELLTWFREVSLAKTLAQPAEVTDSMESEADSGRKWLGLLGEVRPRYAFVENSPMLTSRGLGRVLGDLAALGFDAEWGVLGARDVGASHLRERIWLLASNTDNARLEGREQRSENRLFKMDNLFTSRGFPQSLHDLPEPILFGSGNGMAHRVDRTKAVGNGQVPRVAAAAFTILSQK